MQNVMVACLQSGYDMQNVMVACMVLEVEEVFSL